MTDYDTWLEAPYADLADFAAQVEAAEEAEERRRNEQMQREYGHIAKLTRAEVYELMGPYMMDRCEPCHVHPIARRLVNAK